MPSTRFVFNTAITINHPLEKVWNTISNFHDMSWCPNVVTSCVSVGDINGKRAGAVRILNDEFREILKEINVNNHVIRYAIENGPAPISEVSGFVSEIKLIPVGSGGTQVQWSAFWNASNNEAVSFCETMFVGMMNDLKETMKKAIAA